MSEKTYNFDFAPTPIKENVFGILSNIILDIKYIEDDWLCVGYTPKRKDLISCIQTCKDNNGVGYDVEIVMNFKDDDSFSIFSFYTEDVRDVLDVFHFVCVEFKCPIDVSFINKNGKVIQYIKNTTDRFHNPKWFDITNNTNYLSEEELNELSTKEKENE